jgi:phosphopantetheine--protein transferase-like protein
MAALFAAKEATLKALGTGLRGHSWQQVEVLHRESGDPYVVLYGQALETAGRLGITSIHISLSHDRERAVAFCIAEGEE